VLAPFVLLQSYNGIAWKMDYKVFCWKFYLKNPILSICGDLEGQDKLVGRRMIYRSGSGTFNGQICRYCDVPNDETDNPFYCSKLTKASDISKLLVQ
jgi:hypothetical protein